MFQGKHNPFHESTQRSRLSEVLIASFSMPRTVFGMCHFTYSLITSLRFWLNLHTFSYAWGGNGLTYALFPKKSNRKKSRA